MRAVWYDRQGAADDVLVCGELPMPEAGHGEVRVRVKAPGVTPSDTYRRRGPPAMEYPRVVTNSDGAGVVDQVGPGVPERWLGERVWLYNGPMPGFALPYDLIPSKDREFQAAPHYRGN